MDLRVVAKVARVIAMARAAGIGQHRRQHDHADRQGTDRKTGLAHDRVPCRSRFHRQICRGFAAILANMAGSMERVTGQS